MKFGNESFAQIQEEGLKNYTYYIKWGSFGEGDGQFLSPHGIAVDSIGNVYVSDRERNDIQKFTNNGTFIKKWGKSGGGQGEFNHPYELRIDTNDTLYVVDKFNNRIQVFDTNGTFLRMYDTVGNSNITFNAPEALAVDPLSGVMYIADTGNNRVVKVSNNFDFIKQWGKNGTGPGEFVHPHGIDLDSIGNVYVNELEPRIQKFDRDGNFIRQWGGAGDGPGQFAAHLEHIIIDGEDNIWQVDGEENSRVTKFDTDGNYLGSVGSGPCVIEDEVRADQMKMAGPLPCDGKLNGPEHATVDDLTGNLFVVDRFNYRIVGYKPPPMDRPFPVQTVFTGINYTSNMAFVGPNDILVLEKNNGTVHRITNGVMLDKPLLDVNVVHSDGLLGIAVSKNETGPTYVFLYFTESPKEYGHDVNTEEEIKVVNSTLGYIRECNCLYRYELVDNKLVNPKLLLSLPAGPGGMLHGGEVVVGPDKNVYVVIGSVQGEIMNSTKSKAQNFENGTEPDGRAGILRVTQDGEPVGNGPLGNRPPLNLYYSYGIWNSFGMDFDPITGKLWDTENGPDRGDEINLIEPGFNSGSLDIHGMSFAFAGFNNETLANFNGSGEYSDPEFVWDIQVAPTAIKFLNSSKYGDEFKNDLFVGDINNGNLYHFEPNKERDMLLLNGTLADKVATSKEELKDIIFMDGFNGITDIQVSPDGYIYVLGNRAIYKILPNEGN